MKKEKPILFSTAMVQAIIAGNKTQTRRIIKIPKRLDKKYFFENFHFMMIDCNGDIVFKHDEDNITEIIKKPYKVGQVLWVRETWRVTCASQGNYGQNTFDYKAGGSMVKSWGDGVPRYGIFEKWRPSIFMPREACRLFLEITEVRAERLQDITSYDILKEGIPIYMGKTFTLDKREHVPGLHNKWINLWDSINAKRGYSWDSNPLVWVISFKVLKK